MVMALVILIVLAFVTVGASIWLYWQLSAATSAIKENQADFDKIVGDMFVTHDWDLPSDPAAQYGLQYRQETYRAVVAQLEKAADHYELMPFLGWESIEAVKAKLTRDGSPVQSEIDEPYGTLEGLLGKYESEYVTLTKEIAGLRDELEDTNRLVREKTAAADAERERLKGEYVEASARHAKAMEESTRQFEGMQDLYNKVRAETVALQKKLQDAAMNWEAERRKLLAEAVKWETLYIETRSPEERAEIMRAAGKVLQVDASRAFVMLEGGKDMDREKNASMVVYSESLTGQRNRKGRLLITNVFDITSLATIIRQEERLLAGDLYVTQAVWDKFVGPESREVLPVEVPAVAAPEEVEPAEEVVETPEEVAEPEIAIEVVEQEEVEEEEVEEEVGVLTEEEALEFFE